MFEPRIRIDRELHRQVKEVARQAGYSSVDEFVTHLLEKAVADARQSQSEQDVRQRLKGLGYIE